MVNKNKQKGSNFERRLVNILNEELRQGDFKRVPASGSMGTSLQEPMLMSDVVGRINGFPKKFRIECKVGYGGEKYFTLRKEWLDKISKEAESIYSIPLLAGRFSGSRSGVEDFIVMDIRTFCELMNWITDEDEQISKLMESKDE